MHYWNRQQQQIGKTVQVPNSPRGLFFFCVPALTCTATLRTRARQMAFPCIPLLQWDRPIWVFGWQNCLPSHSCYLSRPADRLVFSQSDVIRVLMRDDFRAEPSDLPPLSVCLLLNLAFFAAAAVLFPGWNIRPSSGGSFIPRFKRHKNVNEREKTELFGPAVSRGVRLLCRTPPLPPW